jgi:teichuronic acid biosynthesis glycosyltransferase TuaC
MLQPQNEIFIRYVSQDMKVLFVASGNPETKEVVPFIKAQAVSIQQEGVEVIFAPIPKGSGLKGYLKARHTIHALAQSEKINLVHAHYTLSGWSAVLARPGKPIVLSLMGDDAYGTYIAPGKVKLKSRYLTLLTLLIQPFVKAIISKAHNIDRFVYRRNIANIIPNGVRMDQFKDHAPGFREKLGLAVDKKHVLFLGDPGNPRKNFNLVKTSVDLLNRKDVVLIAPYPIPHDQVVQYLNTADVFVMPAFMEGSPNVIKEAMACNCPIVTTDVGDAAWVIGDTKGCFVSSFDPQEFSDKIRQALYFSEAQGRTNGRKRILELGLDAPSIAQRIIKIYQFLVE